YDANGDLLIRRGPDQTVLYLAGQELHYDTTAKKFSAQRYYAAGAATAVRTEFGLNWMVDDHHGTASMTVDPTTQAVTRRYTKPFGETRGATPPAWPDDKGFLGKPTDADTGLTHVGAREYDPATGRFLSVDPVLAPDDHESLNGYAYANNTPVTLADPTGLRPDGMCGGASSSCNGGTESWTKSRNGWDWSYTKTYTSNGTVGGTAGTFTTVVTQTQNSTTAKITFKKGPDPVPVKRFGFTNILGHLAGVANGAMAATDLINPPCWIISDFCHYHPEATDKMAAWAGADTDSSLYELAKNNGFLGGTLAVGGRFSIEDGEVGAAGASRAAKGADSAENVVNGIRLNDALRWESAGSLFNKDGSLTEEAIKNSVRIQRGSQMNNTEVVKLFEDRGGVGQWGKYSTERHQAPNGMNFEAHFYMNEETGEVLVYDYKVKFPKVIGGDQ
ncbi:RHS repeat-associated core domain-containing protein, partial [Streptomyces sp. NPDC059837]|uniref:RHS repeat-associated core domain-containing protein n=1 Tax=Streptomyces sp. NPDC059837 TaxID=3346968 RepID=UPI003648EAF1